MSFDVRALDAFYAFNDDDGWAIPYLIVDTKNWWPGKKVLIPTSSARDIVWDDRLVYLGNYLGRGAAVAATIDCLLDFRQ